MKDLTHLSLFSGIGGLDLAAEAAGFRTVGQCEWADYPTKVLEKHWQDVPRWRDIRTLTGDDFYARTGRRSVTVVSGGFPCQPFSVAGKRRGKEDDRYLWPQMLRVISEIRPTWVIGENVPGIINLALDTVLSDLENQGYACQTFIIPAAGVDAPHRRERICIVGYSKHNGLSSTEITGSVEAASYNESERKNTTGESERAGKSESYEDVANTDCNGRSRQPSKPSEIRRNTDKINPIVSKNSDVSDTESTECKESMCSWARRSGFADSREIMADASRARLERPEQCKNDDRKVGRRTQSTTGTTPECSSNERGYWPTEPNVGRAANGIPSRVDRLKCLGNAVVPPQFYPFFRYIAKIETGGVKWKNT